MREETDCGEKREKAKIMKKKRIEESENEAHKPNERIESGEKIIIIITYI